MLLLRVRVLCVRLSVTLLSHTYMVQDIEMNFKLYDRVMFLGAKFLSLGIHPE